MANCPHLTRHGCVIVQGQVRANLVDHRTEQREVFYPWHPWFGGVVFVHGRMKRGDTCVLRCSQSSEEGTRCLHTPEWMFDRAACCGMVGGDSPRVNRAALDRLKAFFRRLQRQFGWSDRGSVLLLIAERRGRCAIWIAIVSCNRIYFAQPVRVRTGGNSRRKRAKACAHRLIATTDSD